MRRGLRFPVAVVGACLGIVWASRSPAVTNGTQAGSFLLIAPGARPAAMGEAFTGLADDVSAASWNPAGLSQLGGMETSLSYAAWFADTSYSVVGLGSPIAPGHVLAGTLYYFHVPRIANVPDEVEPGVDLTNYALGASYAWQVSQRLSVGGGLKLLSQDIVQKDRPQSAGAGAMVDLGMQYRLEGPGVTLGLALQNMGPKLAFRDASSPAPFWARAGSCWRAYSDEWLKVLFTGDVAQPVETGYKLVIPSGGFSDIFKMSLRHPAQNRYNYGLGTEWWVADVLALRAGWAIRVGTDISSPTAGAGLRFSVDPCTYSLDYSYAFWEDLSANISRVSFTLGYHPRPHESAE